MGGKGLERAGRGLEVRGRLADMYVSPFLHLLGLCLPSIWDWVVERVEQFRTGRRFFQLQERSRNLSSVPSWSEVVVQRRSMDEHHAGCALNTPFASLKHLRGVRSTLRSSREVF